MLGTSSQYIILAVVVYQVPVIGDRLTYCILGLTMVSAISIIRAKRVSNCYQVHARKKKLTVCVSGCSANLGFSVEKLSWF